jgi:hypothetical protein
MSEEFIVPNVEILLEGLYHQDHFLRKAAIESVGKYEIDDKRIISALIDIASHDSNIFVKQAAANTLLKFENVVLLDNESDSSDIKNLGNASKLFTPSTSKLLTPSKEKFPTRLQVVLGILFVLLIVIPYLLFMYSVFMCPHCSW